jgi:hypothetical protein
MRAVSLTRASVCGSRIARDVNGVAHRRAVGGTISVVNLDMFAAARLLAHAVDRQIMHDREYPGPRIAVDAALMPAADDAFEAVCTRSSAAVWSRSSARA